MFLTGEVQEIVNTTEVVNAFSEGLDVVGANAVEMMAEAMPIGLGVAGVTIAVRLGMKFFRSLAH